MIKCATKAFVFDLDGTLIDTTPLVIQHWTNFAKEYGLDANKILATSHGRRSIETIAEWVPEKATPEIVDMYERQLADQTEGVTILPGVHQLLENIKHGHYSVNTAGTLYMADKRLSQFDIVIPPVLVTGDKVTHGKPHPEGYLKAAEGMQKDPKDCVVFEDAPAGVRSAKAAGMTAIACLTTHTAEQLKEAGADFIVTSLSDVDIRRLPDDTYEVTVKPAAT